MTTNDATLMPEQAVARLEAADAANPTDTRQLAEHLIASGEVNENTTLADVKTILEKYYAVTK